MAACLPVLRVWILSVVCMAVSPVQLLQPHLVAYLHDTSDDVADHSCSEARKSKTEPIQRCAVLAAHALLGGKVVARKRQMTVFKFKSVSINIYPWLSAAASP